MEEDKFGQVFERTLANIRYIPDEGKELLKFRLSDYIDDPTILYTPQLLDSINSPENTDYPDYRIKPQDNIFQINEYYPSKKEIYENSKYDDYGSLISKNSLNKIYDDKFNDLKLESFSINSIKNTILNLPSPGWAQTNVVNQIPLPTNLGNYFDFSSIGAEELPEMALPVIDFIKDKKPHVVIGCDRGGRMFSLAIHATWQETEEEAFPTIDSKIHFTRISKSEDESVLQEKVDAIIEQAKMLAEQRGTAFDEDEQLRVLFVDDWVCGGGTVRLCERLMKKHGAKTYFAVMVGPGADVSGDSKGSKSVNWSDKPEEIGVNYLSSMTTDEQGNVKQELEVVAVRGEEAIRNRKKIHTAAKKLSKVVEEELVAA